MEFDSIKSKIVFHVGMPRTGSTFLYQSLIKHPNISGPSLKEINYFSNHYQKTQLEYLNHFTPDDNAKIYLDFSPRYFFGSECLDRILRFNSQARIIMGVRKPSDFLVSQYKQFRHSSLKKSISFEEFLDKGIDVLIMGVGESRENPLSDERLISFFSSYKETVKKNLFLYSFELFGKDILSLLKSIEKFLELDSFFSESNFQKEKINASSRDTSKLFLYLKTRPFVFNLINQPFFPTSLVSQTLNSIRGKSESGKKTEVASAKDLKDLSLAREFYKKSDDYYESLFSKKNLVQLGDGSSFL